MFLDSKVYLVSLTGTFLLRYLFSIRDLGSSILDLGSSIPDLGSLYPVLQIESKGNLSAPE